MTRSITLQLTPSQLASIRGISIHDIFTLIHNGSLPYLATNEGIHIPVTYIWDDND